MQPAILSDARAPAQKTKRFDHSSLANFRFFFDDYIRTHETPFRDLCARRYDRGGMNRRREIMFRQQPVSSFRECELGFAHVQNCLSSKPHAGLRDNTLGDGAFSARSMTRRIEID